MVVEDSIDESHNTPGTPKFLIVRPMVDEEKNSTDDKKEYQFEVRMLLLLVKCIRPNIATTSRDLSEANDGVNISAFHELLLVIRYVMSKRSWFRVTATMDASKTMGNYLFQH